jgi:uncharacterized membrane-anchored protein
MRSAVSSTTTAKEDVESEHFTAYAIKEAQPEGFPHISLDDTSKMNLSNKIGKAIGYSINPD